MSKIKIDKARLSYPSLFKRSVFQGQEGKYEATLLVEKSSKIAKTIVVEAKKACKEAGVDYGKLRTSGKSCVRDGDESDRPEAEGCLTIKARNEMQPPVFDRDRSKITDAGRVYAGCYVAAVITFWVQDNAFGRRLNANLLGVQFVEDGEAFGGGGAVAQPGDFDALDEGVADDFDDETSF